MNLGTCIESGEECRLSSSITLLQLRLGMMGGKSRCRCDCCCDGHSAGRDADAGDNMVVCN